MTLYNFDFFPVDYPVDSFNTSVNAKFGSLRDGGQRVHAGCDLYVEEGTPVRAVASGTVMSELCDFYHETFAIVIDHGHFVARYGELQAYGERPVTLATVRAGDIVGYVRRTLKNDKKSYNRPMLHFELYSKSAKGLLTNRNNKPTQRRSDLVDPTLSLATALIGLKQRLQIDAERRELELRGIKSPLSGIF